MAYTGYFGKAFYQLLFYKAFADYDPSNTYFNGLANLYLGTGTSLSFNANGLVQNAWPMSLSYAPYDLSSAANWGWLTSGSGTGYNTQAITITNWEGSTKAVGNIGIFHQANGNCYGYISISPTISLGHGDSIVIPTTGLKFTFT